MTSKKKINLLSSGDFQEVLDGAWISEEYYFNGRGEDYEYYFDLTPEETTQIRTYEGYSIEVGCDDLSDYAILRAPSGEVCGFYYRFMAWIDEEHRGKGLCPQMIFAFAQHFGEDAWGDDLQDCQGGMGFTEEGFTAHESARLIAMEQQAA